MFEGLPSGTVCGLRTPEGVLDGTGPPGCSRDNFDANTHELWIATQFYSWEEPDFRPRKNSPLAASGAGAYLPAGLSQSYWIPGAVLNEPSFPIPRDGKTVWHEDVALIFLHAKGCDRHQVIVSQDKDLVTDFAIDNPHVQAKWFDAGKNIWGKEANLGELKLEQDKTYFWRVQPSSECENARPSRVWTFKTSSSPRTFPPVPQPLEPTHPLTKCKGKVPRLLESKELTAKGCLLEARTLKNDGPAVFSMCSSARETTCTVYSEDCTEGDKWLKWLDTKDQDKCDLYVIRDENAAPAPPPVPLVASHPKMKCNKGWSEKQTLEVKGLRTPKACMAEAKAVHSSGALVFSFCGVAQGTICTVYSDDCAIADQVKSQDNCDLFVVTDGMYSTTTTTTTPDVLPSHPGMKCKANGQGWAENQLVETKGLMTARECMAAAQNVHSSGPLVFSFCKPAVGTICRVYSDSCVPDEAKDQDNCDLFIEADGVYSTTTTTTTPDILPSYPGMKCKAYGQGWAENQLVEKKGFQTARECMAEAQSVHSSGPLVFSFCKPAVGTICRVYSDNCVPDEAREQDNCDLFIKTDGAYSTTTTTTTADILPSYPKTICKGWDEKLVVMKKGFATARECMAEAQSVHSSGPLVFSFCKPAVGTICRVYSDDCVVADQAKTQDNCDLFIKADGVYSTMVTTTAAPMPPTYPNMKCKKDWGVSLMEKGLKKPQDCLDQAKIVASDGPLVFSFCKPAVGTICTVYTNDCTVDFNFKTQDNCDLYVVPQNRLLSSNEASIAKAEDRSGSLRGTTSSSQAMCGESNFKSPLCQLLSSIVRAFRSSKGAAIIGLY